jgi:3-oxoacyl-[acyl-carrier-protein] synthase-3
MVIKDPEKTDGFQGLFSYNQIDTIMKTLNSVITGIASALPEYRLTNEELSQMVDTNDEWIMSRAGIKERRILKGEHQGVSVLGTQAVSDLLKKTNTKPGEVDAIILATTTPDHFFPSTASIVAEQNGIKNAFCLDMSAACSGFIFGLELCNGLIKTGRYKKVILIAAEKMSSIVNYEDRNTCPLFGDGAGAVMIEPSEENIGIIDAILHTDGVGYSYLHMLGGGSKYPASHETVEKKMHYVYQEGKHVFKYAVSNMADVSVAIMKRNSLTANDISWLVPHQANMRIIEAAQQRTGVPMEKVMINIEKYGNTSGATIPIALAEYESKLKKGDNIILTAFGAGFTWGAVYLKWGY